MAISRMQMDRQLYEGGGIITLTPRSKYGLGSKLKKFVRKIIPNEVSEIAVKAAPFVAPFNPLLAGAMSGIGSFDQTGSLTKGLTRGALTYGGGQLARYLGGAGFQEGINPFAGADFSGGFLSGIQSLGTSPIGTETGLRLGQYKMFGGTPTQEIVSSGQPPLVNEGSIATGIDSSKAYYPTDFATEALPLEQATTGITTAGQTAAQKATTPGYIDLFKQVLSGDAQQKTQALKQLGGKALKDIYTKPVPGSPGETQIDKLAIGATIAGGMSYLEAKKLAEEAGIVDNADEYTEEMYNADKSRYSNYYSQILTPEAFGITSKADGGRVGFAYGTPSQESGIPSITLTKQDNTEVAGLSKNRVAQLMSLLEDPTIDEDYRKQIQDEIRLLMGKKDGGRIGFKDGPTKEGIVSINPMQDDLEELLGPGAGIMAPGLAKIMSKGVPTFTSAEKTLVIRNLAGRGKGTAAYKELGVTIPEAKAIMDNPAANLKDATILKEFIKAIMGKKEGGRIGYKDAGFVLKGQRRDPYEIIAGMDNELNPGLLDKIPFFGASKYSLDEDQGASLIKEIQDYKYGESYPNETIGVMEKGVFNVIPKPDRLPMSMEKTISTMEAEWDKAIEEGHRPGRGGKFDDLGIYSKEDIRRRVELGFDQARGPEIQKRNMRAANGGRIGFMMGSEVPVRQNQAGVSEMDYRNTGGFVPPIGVKEKADDIPAMLSNNEFVFTADAVRAAGGGSVNKGAQKMYALMKQLEGKVV